MWGIVYVCVVWTLMVLGTGLLVTGLVIERPLRSAVGLLMLVAVVAIMFIAMGVRGLST